MNTPTPSYPQGDAIAYWKGRAETAERELAAAQEARQRAEEDCSVWIDAAMEARERARRAEAALDALKAHAEAMHGWIDRVLSCVERAEQDIGGESMATIIADGGPLFAAYRRDFPKDAP